MVWSQFVEQLPSPPEQHGDELDLHLIEQAGPQALPRRVGTVQHHVPVSGGGPGLSDARLDAVGDEPDVAGGWPSGAAWVGTKTGTPL